MQKKNILTSLTLAAMVAAGLSTAALAQEAAPGGPEAEMNFDLLDADKDGKVTQAEIAALMKARFDAADANKDGKISAEELVAMREAERAARQRDMAARMIARMDTDKDGLLSAEEMAAGPRPASMFERVDTDGDGAITREEADAAKTRMQDHMRGPKGGEGRGRHHSGPDGGPDGERGGDRGAEGGFWNWLRN